jgi:hypothetical protein
LALRFSGALPHTSNCPQRHCRPTCDLPRVQHYSRLDDPFDGYYEQFRLQSWSSTCLITKAGRTGCLLAIPQLQYSHTSSASLCQVWRLRSLEVTDCASRTNVELRISASSDAAVGVPHPHNLTKYLKSDYLPGLSVAAWNTVLWVTEYLVHTERINHYASSCPGDSGPRIRHLKVSLHDPNEPRSSSDSSLLRQHILTAFHESIRC